jgi:type II secretory pathway component PulF
MRGGRTGCLSEELRRFLTDLVYPVVADRRLAELILFYRQMATLAKAGIPIIEALRLREERAPRGMLRAALRDAIGQAERGGKLSAAFERWPEIFPPFQIAMIHAGEEGGVLDESLGRLADYLEAEQRLRRFINLQTTYPKILFVIAQFVLPAFWAFVFGGSVIGAIAGPLMGLLYLAVAICIVFAAARGVMSRVPQAATTYERIKWALPGIGPVARNFALCRFGRALGTLYAAGVPLLNSLRLSGRASGSRQITRVAEEMCGYVEHGVNLGEACRATAFFPTRTADMMATGAESGSVDSMMLRMADYLEAETEERAHKTAYLLSIGFYLLIALYVTGLIQMAGGALVGTFAR